MLRWTEVAAKGPNPQGAVPSRPHENRGALNMDIQCQIRGFFRVVAKRSVILFRSPAFFHEL